MPRPGLIKLSLFAVFAVPATMLSTFWEPVWAAEGRQSLDVVREKEKTVYTVDSPGSNDNHETARAWDMLQKLTIDSWRGDDGKGPDSDRRGRREHP